jgi:hypothetical protein
VERPFAPCSVKSAQAEVTGVLSDLHLAEYRLDDRSSPGVVGSSGLGAEAPCHTLLGCRVLRDAPSRCGRESLVLAQRPVATSASRSSSASVSRLSFEQ